MAPAIIKLGVFSMTQRLLIDIQRFHCVTHLLFTLPFGYCEPCYVLDAKQRLPSLKELTISANSSDGSALIKVLDGLPTLPQISVARLHSYSQCLVNPRQLTHITSLELSGDIQIDSCTPSRWPHKLQHIYIDTVDETYHLIVPDLQQFSNATIVELGEQHVTAAVLSELLSISSSSVCMAQSSKRPIFLQSGFLWRIQEVSPLLTPSPS